MRVRVLRLFLSAIMILSTNASLLSQRITPEPPIPVPPHTPQEILLLFSGNTASERILLTLNNNRAESLTTSIVVYTVSGTPIPLSPISLVSNESKQIELSPLLLSAHAGNQTLGWLKLGYEGVVMEMGAQLTLYPGDGTIGIDSPRSLTGDFKTTARDAVFWVPGSGEARLSLTNNSSASILTTLHCDFLEEAVLIAPHNTVLRTIAPPPLGPFSPDGAPLACEIKSNGAPDALRAVGTVTAPSYSTPVRFYDPATATFKNLTSVGLDTAARTHVVIRNVTSLPVLYTPVLREATLAEPYTQSLPRRLIGPHASTRVDVADLLLAFEARGITKSTLSLETDSPKGSLIGAVSQKNSFDGLVEDIPLRTSNPPATARGSYPLRWDQDYKNSVTVTNTADKVLRIGASITAGDVVYVLKREDISPGSTIIFDVDKLRHDQVPNVNGKYLPLDANYGKIHWIEMGMGENAGLLGRTSLSSVLNKRRSSFSCGSTCYYSYDGFGFYDPLPWAAFAVGDSMAMSDSEHVRLVYASAYTYPYNYGGLASDHPSIVSAGNVSNTAQANEGGVGMGST